MLAFFRIRTITGSRPITVVPSRTSIFTSPSDTLGCPKRPRTKNGTEAPSIGSCSDRLALDEPVAVSRNTTAPPVAPDWPVRVTLTTEVLAPEESVSRIRQGDGAQVRYRARGLTLLFICKSTVTCGNIFGQRIVFGRLHLMGTASQEKTAQNDVVLATSAQLGLVSWIPSVKRVETYSQNKGDLPCAVK